MRAGKLVHAVKIERATHAVNDTGGPVTTWSHYAWLRAEKVEQSTAEAIRAYGASEETLLVFRTRFKAGVTNADRLVWRGEAFNLREVVVLGRNLGLELRCVRMH
jgi:SPP1 family predicted phage head-tail adaptor